MPKKLYMVIEHFKNAPAVYRRFREHGRMLPEGLLYVSSWVGEGFERCYQLMETDDPKLLDHWMANWSDLADFEVHPVITSSEAAERMASACSNEQTHQQSDEFARRKSIGRTE